MKPKKTLKNQKGSAAVEFAIVLPLLILMFIGICEFGLLWYNKQVVINASRESARAGIAREYDSDINFTNGNSDPIVNAYCANRLITFGPTVDPVTTYPDGRNIDKSFGEDFSVKVFYLYTSLFGAGPSIPLGRTTLMRMEHIPL